MTKYGEERPLYMPSMAGYATREEIKAKYREIMHDETRPLHERVEAAEHVMEALYWRSAEAHHPSYWDYVAMILHEGKEGQPYLFPDDVRKEMVKIYGRKKGIELGTYYFGDEDTKRKR